MLDGSWTGTKGAPEDLGITSANVLRRRSQD